jgi:mRNA interferase HigB
MNIYNKSAILEFGKKHANAKKQLVLWYNDVLTKRWKTPNDVKKDFITASIINQSRVVFNIKGNDFRLVADINYSKQWLFIKFIGTHSAYDLIDAATVDVYSKPKKKK